MDELQNENVDFSKQLDEINKQLTNIYEVVKPDEEENIEDDSKSIDDIYNLLEQYLQDDKQYKENSLVELEAIKETLSEIKPADYTGLLESSTISNTLIFAFLGVFMIYLGCFLGFKIFRRM